MSSLSETEISNKKLAAGLTGIFLGAFGVHKFILGYTKPAVIMLVVSLLTCGVGYFVFQVIGIVEGVIYLTKSNAEFETEYLDGQKDWFSGLSSVPGFVAFVWSWGPQLWPGCSYSPRRLASAGADGGPAAPAVGGAALRV